MTPRWNSSSLSVYTVYIKMEGVMQTAVVSGRVDQVIKERADRVIRASGLTVADVIKATWFSIAQTGELPEALTAPASKPAPSAQFSRFVEFVEMLPPAPEVFAGMSDAQMKDLLGERDV